jgi:CBS domain-containing protein
LDPKSTTVEEIMTPDVTFCFDDEDVQEAARIMEDEQIRRLVVLNRSKRLVGIVSLGDLAVETGDDLLSGHALEMISEPVHAL